MKMAFAKVFDFFEVREPASASELRIGSAAILLLALEWIIFGSMHFSLPQKTVPQIPYYIPWKDAVAIISGMIEVSIGCLMLVSRARRYAALASLTVLIIYILAVYQMLSSPDNSLADPPWGGLFKIGLIPNNILLGVCSIFVMQHPDLVLMGGSRSERSPSEAAVRRRRPAAGATPVVAAIFFGCNCAGFLAIWLNAFGAEGEGSMWGMGCLAIGALLGFLFGIPKVNRSRPTNNVLLPNTNIEEVSDWLTKIIVGVSLVNMKSIAHAVLLYADQMALSMHITATFAVALIVYFTTLGMIEGYVLTRIFLAREFQRISGDGGRVAG